MKRKRRRTAPNFPPLSSRVWGLRRRSGDDGSEAAEVVHALERAVNEAGVLGFATQFDMIDKLLSIAEPWVDSDILRAHLLRDGDPAPGTRFGIAFVPGDGNLIDPTRWYVLPPVTAGEVPMRVVAVALDSDQYRVLVNDGFRVFFARVLSDLKGRGIEPRSDE